MNTLLLPPKSIAQELFDPNITKTGFYLTRPYNGLKSPQSNLSSTCVKPTNEENLNKSTTQENESNASVNNKPIGENDSTDKSNIQTLCDTMKRQIISRAFYGWLAHCRHLRTVRTHLADLVNLKIIRSDDPIDASSGITEQIWESMVSSDGKITNFDEVYRLIYFGGIQHSLRKTVWPYLLGHYNFDSTIEEKSLRDKEMQQMYEMIMSEWLAVEAIVRQRDKEIVAANLAKLSSESNSAEIPLTGPKDPSLSNDVFEEFSESDDSKPSSRKSSTNTNDSHIIKEINKPISAARRQLQRHKQVESQSSQNIIVTNPSVDVLNSIIKTEDNIENADQSISESQHLPINPESNSQCVSPVSSNGGVYTVSFYLFK